MEMRKTYYHGTDLDSAIDICKKICLNKSSESLDFGPGFYITESRKTAERWALRKARVRKKEAAIVIIDFNYSQAEPYIVKFENDLRWGQFVINNRNGYEYINKIVCNEHNLDAKYNITYGRIADYFVSDVARDLKNKGIPLENLNDILNPFYSYQYAFHTEKALGFLKCLKYEIVKEV